LDGSHVSDFKVSRIDTDDERDAPRITIKAILWPSRSSSQCRFLPRLRYRLSLPFPTYGTLHEPSASIRSDGRNRAVHLGLEEPPLDSVGALSPLHDRLLAVHRSALERLRPVTYRKLANQIGPANCSVRHEPCFLEPPFPRRAWLAPHSAVADLWR